MAGLHGQDKTNANDDQYVVLRNDAGTQTGEFTGDRFKVDAISGTNPAVPVDIVNHAIVELLDGASSAAMNIDGSITPVEFTVGPPNGETWYVDSVGFAFSDSGAAKGIDWGGINLGLANGFLIETTIGTVDREIANLKSNIGIVTTFDDGGFAGGNSGFITDANFYSGLLNLTPNITLIGSASEVIKATVRDNLTGLVSQKMIIHYWVVL